MQHVNLSPRTHSAPASTRARPAGSPRSTAPSQRPEVVPGSGPMIQFRDLWAVWFTGEAHLATLAVGMVGGPRRQSVQVLSGAPPRLSYVVYLLFAGRREVQNDLHVVGTVRQHIPILFQGYPSGQHSFKPCGVCSRQRGRSL